MPPKNNSWTRRLGRRFKPLHRFIPQQYDALTLSDDDIRRGEHRKHLGGGPEEWDTRGRYQVALMQHYGLRPDHTLLDVGCGPARAGVHLIEYLAQGRYVGIDYNESILEAARYELSSRNLADRAELHLVNDFDFTDLDVSADFVLLFSVLNHCPPKLRTRFFEQVLTVTKPGSRIVISHATWDTDPGGHDGLDLVEVFDPPAGSELDPARWSWVEQRPDPFLVLERA
jgi:SAM-dependent methyltransferase